MSNDAHCPIHKYKFCFFKIQFHVWELTVSQFVSTFPFTKIMLQLSRPYLDLSFFKYILNTYMEKSQWTSLTGIKLQCIPLLYIPGRHPWRDRQVVFFSPSSLSSHSQLFLQLPSLVLSSPLSLSTSDSPSEHSVSLNRAYYKFEEGG